jgi:hypothetical protein
LPIQRRLPPLQALGRELGTPREVRPDDFDLPEWISKAEAKLNELRLSGPELKLAAGVDRPGEGLLRKGLIKDQVRPLLLHRFAVNLYTIDHAPRTVQPEALSRFLGELPSWIRSALNDDDGDWARRKLEVAYRLLFPYPTEFRPEPSAARAVGKPAGPVPPSDKSAPVNPPRPSPPPTTPF